LWQINRCASSYINKSKGRHKICIHRREEGNPQRNFQGDKAYVGEPLIDTPHKITRSQDITDAQKKENKYKARKYFLYKL